MNLLKPTKRYLFPADYMADPSVHVFNGKLYVYPSHDWECENVENDNGDQYVMKDMHVLSTDDPMNGEVIDHGKALDIADIPWAGRQLWDCACAEKDGKYYLYFPLKDKNDIFRIGVAIADSPEGPFIPQPVGATLWIYAYCLRMANIISISVVCGADSSSVTVTTKRWNVPTCPKVTSLRFRAAAYALPKICYSSLKNRDPYR